MAQVKGNCSLDVCPLQKAQTVVALPEAIKNRLADAYAEQGRSDFAVYRVHLKNADECHRLHYLQMACEKIAKAYRLRDTPLYAEENLYSHIAFSRFIIGFLKAKALRERYRSQDAKRRQIERYARGLAEDIEKLAPAVDHEQTPANAEYPWVANGAVFVPTRYHFAVSMRLAEPAGRDFLNLIETIIEEFQSIKLSG